MKTRTKILPIVVVALAPFVLSGCYTTISQSVYARPIAQFPDQGTFEKSVPANDENVSQGDSVVVETDQQGIEAEDDNSVQDDGNQYENRPPFNDQYYGGQYGGPYAYNDWRYRPGWNGSFIWDPYIFTPHLHFGMMYNSWDPFTWRDPWAFGFGYDPWYNDPWYSPYYAMYDPWYYNSYYPGYDRGYGGYDSWHHGGGHGGGNHEDYTTGPRYTRQDRLAGFGAFSTSGSVYTQVNSTTGKTASETKKVQPVTRVGSRDGFGTSSTRRSGTARVTEKSTAGNVTTPGKRTVSQNNSTVRQRTQTQGMIRRGSNTESYTITIPNDGSGRPVVQYRDQNNQTDYQKEIRISRQDESDEAAVKEAATVNRSRVQDRTQARRARVTDATQPSSSPADNAPDTERAVSRPATTQNSTPSETSETSRTYSPSPSRDTGRSTPSYSTPSRGGSSPSYSPRSGGGSSSGSQGRSSGSRSGGRRR